MAPVSRVCEGGKDELFSLEGKDSHDHNFRVLSYHQYKSSLNFRLLSRVTHPRKDPVDHGSVLLAAEILGWTGRRRKTCTRSLLTSLLTSNSTSTRKIV